MITSVERETSGIAHDLNNQMMLILNHVQFALDRVPTEDPLHRDLFDVRRAAERCTEMVDSLLRPGAERTHTSSPLDMAAALSEAGRLLARSLPANIELIVEADANLVRIEADAGKIQRLLTNLALNARDAMPNGGTLRILARNVDGKAGRHLELTVCDTGCGMSPELQKRIWKPYFTTKRDSGGSGLGLSIVAEIVRSHEARLTCKSEPGQGTRFRIVFPCSRME